MCLERCAYISLSVAMLSKARDVLEKSLYMRGNAMSGSC